MVKRFSQRSSGSGMYGQQQASRRGSGKRIASLRLTPNNLFIIIEAPYDAGFTDTLKQSIPMKKRTWDNNDKSWYVCTDQLDKVTHILERFYDETILLDFPAQDIATDAWSKLFLIQGAPIELIQAAYRILAKKNHPDVGGDPEKMKVINVAYKELMGNFTNGDE